jgi:hypothetical protein
MHTCDWGDWHRQSVLGLERGSTISPNGSALARGMIIGQELHRHGRPPW